MYNSIVNTYQEAAVHLEILGDLRPRKCCARHERPKKDIRFPLPLAQRGKVSHTQPQCARAEQRRNPRCHHFAEALGDLEESDPIAEVFKFLWAKGVAPRGVIETYYEVRDLVFATDGVMRKCSDKLVYSSGMSAAESEGVADVFAEINGLRLRHGQAGPLPVPPGSDADALLIAAQIIEDLGTTAGDRIEALIAEAKTMLRWLTEKREEPNEAGRSFVDAGITA